MSRDERVMHFVVLEKLLFVEPGSVLVSVLPFPLASDSKWSSFALKFPRVGKCCQENLGAIMMAP